MAGNMNSVMKRMSTGVVMMFMILCSFIAVGDAPVSQTVIHQCGYNTCHTCSGEQSSFTLNSGFVSADPERAELQNWATPEILICCQNFHESAAIGKFNNRSAMLGKICFLSREKYYIFMSLGIEHTKGMFRVFNTKVLMTSETVQLTTFSVAYQQNLLVKFFTSDSPHHFLVYLDVTISIAAHSFSELHPSVGVPGQEPCLIRKHNTTQNSTFSITDFDSKPTADFYMPGGKRFCFSDWCRLFWLNIFNHHFDCQRGYSSMAAVLYLTSNVIYRFIVCLAVVHKLCEGYGNTDDENATILRVSHSRLLSKMHRRWCLKSGMQSKMCLDHLASANCHSVGDWMTSKCYPFNDHWNTPGFMTIQVYPVTRFLPDPTFIPERDLSHVGYRLATLGALPSSVPVSRVRLADAGFYFQGHGEEVLCYSCHLRVSDWSRGGDPWTVHRQLSPQCEHVLARDHELAGLAPGNSQSGAVNPNTPDHQLSAFNTSPMNGHVEDSDNTETQTAGASAEARTTNARRTRASGCLDIQSTDSNSTETQMAGASANPEAQATDARATRGCSSIQSITDADPSSTSNGAGGSSRRLFPQPGLDLGAAVYPMYQDTASRRRSFTSPWNESRAPPLNEIIMSGMFYAGYADCVRCFYCGVGLKTWTVTDNVWTEHVRWRPTCGYLRAIKGDQFIRATQRRLGISNPADDATSQQAVQGSHQAQDSHSLSQDNSTHPPTAQISSPVSHPRPSQVQTVSATVQTSSAEANTTSTASAVNSVAASSTSVGPSALEESGIREPGSASAPARTVSSAGGAEGRRGDEGRQAGACVAEGRRGEEGVGERPGGVVSAEAPGTPGEAGRLARELSENRQLSRQQQCRLCHLAPIDTILMPCGHLVICNTCAASVRLCPLCQCSVTATARVYMDRSNGDSAI